MNNPYLDEAEPHLRDIYEGFKTRRLFVEKYAWAVPNYEAVRTILDHSPIVEIGSGKGYWASLIRAMGGKIHATDLNPEPNAWTEVEKMSASKAVALYGSTHTLLSVWPNYNRSWAYEALLAYTGNVFIYVGESRGGCTGNHQLYDLLEEQWKMVRYVDIPVWDGMGDNLYVYRRGSK